MIWAMPRCSCCLRPVCAPAGVPIRRRLSISGDVITGAANSSLVMENAIQNALKSAPKGT